MRPPLCGGSPVYGSKLNASPVHCVRTSASSSTPHFFHSEEGSSNLGTFYEQRDGALLSEKKVHHRVHSSRTDCLPAKTRCRALSASALPALLQPRFVLPSDRTKAALSTCTHPTLALLPLSLLATTETTSCRRRRPPLTLRLTDAFASQSPTATEEGGGRSPRGGTVQAPTVQERQVKVRLFHPHRNRGEVIPKIYP